MRIGERKRLRRSTARCASRPTCSKRTAATSTKAPRSMRGSICFNTTAGGCTLIRTSCCRTTSGGCCSTTRTWAGTASMGRTGWTWWARGELESFKTSLAGEPQNSHRCFVQSGHHRRIGHRYVDPLRGYCPIGWLQLWHSSAHKSYPYSLGSAAHDDTIFSGLWAVEHRRHLPTVICYHLCAAPPQWGENWDGQAGAPTSLPRVEASRIEANFGSERARLVREKKGLEVQLQTGIAAVRSKRAAERNAVDRDECSHREANARDEAG